MSYPAKGYERATVKSSGCGVCCAALVCGLTVPEARDISLESGARVPGGTDMSRLLKACGVSFRGSDDITELRAALDAGRLAVVNSGGLPLSRGGHYLVALRAADERIVLFDPNLYDGKFAAPERASVRVLSEVITASAQAVSQSCQNRSPAYYIIEEPTINKSIGN